jgi:hypothetical protein
MVESLAVQSIMQPTGFGEEIARDLADLLTLDDSQDQERQRILTIQNVTVAVNVGDIRSSGFGAAVAILNFEITNKNGLIEEMVLRYSYSDPATGQNVYQGEQSITVGAGESVVQTVRVPFSSTGIYEVMVEANSGDGTIASTDVVVEVPWLEVYLYVLTLIMVTVVGAPVAYLVYSLRQGHAPAIMRSSGAEGIVAQLIRRAVAASKFAIQTLQRAFGFGEDMPVGAVRYPAVRATRRLKIALYAMAGAAMTAARAIGEGLGRVHGITFKGLNSDRIRSAVRHSARRIRQLAAMLAPASRTATAAAKEHARYAARALMRAVRFVARQAGYGGST